MTGSVIFVGDVSAQEVTIQTSADDQGSRFFGEGILQVIATDPEADNNDTVEEMQIYIKAKPDSGSADTTSIIVPETIDSSGRFEFFLVHVNAIAVDAGDLDPINSAGVEGDGSCAADCAPFVTFGPGGDLDIQSDLYEDVEFVISEGNIEIKVKYEESVAELGLDRDSYGTTSFVYIRVTDQDANLNPTQRDEFIVDPGSPPNSDLLVLHGGTFEDIVVFRETGDNTAVFEAKYRLGESMLVTSESLVITLFDKVDYNASLIAPENDSNNIDEVSFIVGNSDGTIIDVGGGNQTTIPSFDPLLETDKESYSLGEVVHITIMDQDANINPHAVDSIELQVSSGVSEVEVIAVETGADTGIFEARIRLTAEGNPTAGAIAPLGSVKITYTDLRPSDYAEKVQAGLNPEKDFTLEINIRLPVKTGINATSVSVPAVTNALGETGPFAIGSSLTISTAVTNNNDVPQPFLALVEVRDSNDSTVFLSLQTGLLQPSGSSDIGVLWQPGNAGVFQIRTFVVSNLEELEILSPIATSQIVIN